jgi:hypothetical protein
MIITIHFISMRMIKSNFGLGKMLLHKQIVPSAIFKEIRKIHLYW